MFRSSMPCPSHLPLPPAPPTYPSHLPLPPAPPTCSSTDWRCSVCGVCNKTALAEGVVDDRLQAEAKDIAKQMSFKVSLHRAIGTWPPCFTASEDRPSLPSLSVSMCVSLVSLCVSLPLCLSWSLCLQSEAETKAATEALKKVEGSGSWEEQEEEEEEEEEEKEKGGDHDRRDQDHIEEVRSSPPPLGGGARQRQARHPQEGPRDTEASLAPPRRLPSTPPHPIPQPKGTTSLVVMWLLIIMIFLLVGRRAYLSYSTEDLKNFHP